MALFSGASTDLMQGGGRDALAGQVSASIRAIAALTFPCPCDSCAVDKLTEWTEAADQDLAAKLKQAASMAAARQKVRPAAKTWPISARSLLNLDDATRVELIASYAVNFECTAIWTIIDDLAARGMGENLVTRTEWQGYRRQVLQNKRRWMKVGRL